MEKCPAAVPCAMANEESGSKFKTWIMCGSTLRVTRCEKVALKILFSQMNPCIKIAFRKLNPSLILDLPCALNSVYTPPWVWLDLLSTFILTPFSIFIEEDPDFVPDDVE